MNENEKYMKIALKEAEKAFKEDEIPIGAIIVKEGKVIAKAHNKKEKKKLPTSHAEIEAIQKACKKLDSKYLNDCTLYVTLEPCPMCAGAIIMARLKTVVFGAYDPKGGSLRSTLKMYEIQGFNHYPQVVENILSDQCAKILKDYFKNKRKSTKKNKNMIEY